MAKAKKTTKKNKAKVTKKTTKKPAKKAVPAKKTTKKTVKKTTKKTVEISVAKSGKKTTTKPNPKSNTKKTTKEIKKVVAKDQKKSSKKEVVNSQKGKKDFKVNLVAEKKQSTPEVYAAQAEEKVLESKYQEEVALDKDIEKKIKSVASQKLKEEVAEEVLQLSEDFKLSDIFESIRDISYFQNYSDECIERSCDSPATTKGFCRLHYITNWKNVKKREAILIDGKLQDFIEDLSKSYPLKSIELVLNDLSDEKSFFAALNEMDIESMDEEQDVISDDGIDDDDDMAFETKTTKSGYFDE